MSFTGLLGESGRVRKAKSEQIPWEQRQQLIRDLAAGDLTAAQLGQKYRRQPLFECRANVIVMVGSQVSAPRGRSCALRISCKDPGQAGESVYRFGDTWRREVGKISAARVDSGDYEVRVGRPRRQLVRVAVVAVGLVITVLAASCGGLGRAVLESGCDVRADGCRE